MNKITSVEKTVLLPLALPILAEQILRLLMGTVNTLMLSRYSDDAVAAVGVSNQVLNVVIIAATMIASGAAVIINQNLGAGRDKEAHVISMNSLSISACVGLFFSAILITFAHPIIVGMGLQPGLRPDAIAYLRIVGYSCVIQFVSAMMTTHFRCRGDARKPMFVIAFNNCVNLAGCCMVVFRPFETPLSGVSGVAMIRLASEVLGLLLIGTLYARQGWLRDRRSLWHVRMDNLRLILRLGFLSGAEGISFSMGQLVTTGFLTAFGAVALSTKMYVQTVSSYTYLAGLSIGQATQIMSGHLLGAGRLDEADRFVKRSWRYILSCNVAFSMIMFLLAKPIIGLFTDAAQVLDLAKNLLLIDVFICMGRSFNHSFNYGLRSAGYVFVPMVVANSSIWLVNVGIGYVLSVVLGWGVFGIWVAQMLDEWIRGLFAMGFWLSKRWENSLIVKPVFINIKPTKNKRKSEH